MATIDDRIAKLEEKLAQEKAKKQQIEARKKSIMNKQNRAIDTRKKILIGAAILHRIESGEWNKEGLYNLLNAFLKNDKDRELFSLDKISKNKTD